LSDAPLWRHGPAHYLIVGFILTFAFLGFSCWLCSGRVFAAAGNHQPPYALIFGTVWGPDSRPMYGVKIEIRRQSDHKPRWEQVSDHRGEFAQRVPAGKQDYVVWADLKGVNSAAGKPLHADELQVHIDNDERADVGVHLME
jgi:hypothetical protein